MPEPSTWAMIGAGTAFAASPFIFVCGVIHLACAGILAFLVMIIVYLFLAKGKPLTIDFNYIWKLESKDLAEAIDQAAEETEQLTEAAKDFQEAARDFADIGKDIPREIDISVELSPSERMIDFITFRYVPLAAVALLVLVIGVLYLVYRSYIRAKIRREELQTVIHMYEYERDSHKDGTPEGFVNAMAKGFDGSKPDRRGREVIDV